jgi:adenylyltransferase/sulfurtransferase
VREKSAVDVAAMQARDEPFLLLDVREPAEWEAARIEGARLVPLGQLEGRLAEIEDWKQRRVVVHCRSGARSAKAAKLLQEHGFADVWNLAGGIQAWSLTVDPRVPRT